MSIRGDEFEVAKSHAAVRRRLYLPTLREGFLGSRRWMAAQMGKAGGKVSSKVKLLLLVATANGEVTRGNS